MRTSPVVWAIFGMLDVSRVHSADVLSWYVIIIQIDVSIVFCFNVTGDDSISTWNDQIWLHEFFCLGSNALWSGENQLTFRINIPPSLSVWRSKPSKKHVWSKKIIYIKQAATVVFLFSYFLTLLHWRWRRRYFPPKRLLIFIDYTELYPRRQTSSKLFIVRTSNRA